MEYEKEAKQLVSKSTGKGIYPIVRASDLKNDDGTPYVLPAQLKPSGTDISTNILEFVEDKGIYIGTDTGHWYYWNGTSYANGGVYQATALGIGSVALDNLDTNLQNILVDTNEYTIDTAHGLTFSNTGYLQKDNGTVTSSADGYNTDYIALDGTSYAYTGCNNYATCGIATYDANKTFLRAYFYSADGSTGVTSVNAIWKPQSDEKYARFSSYTNNVTASVYPVIYKTIRDDLNNIKSDIAVDGAYFKNENDLFVKNGFYDSNGHFITTNNQWESTDLIACSNTDVFRLTLQANWNGACITTFNSNQQYLRRYYYSGTEETIKIKNTDWTPQEDEKYVAFTTFVLSLDYKIEKAYPNTINSKLNQIDEKTYNPLYGKKLCVCGDSFSAKFDYLPEGPYGKLIADRNGMVYYDLAVAGRVLHFNTTDGSFLNPSNDKSYINIPTDSDYIIISFGLNEIDNPTEDLDSTNGSYYCGAFNTVMQWIHDNVPNAKVLVISQDAWMTYALRETQKKLAHYWGITFLDFKGPDVPLFAGGKYSEDGYTINQNAITFFNKLYYHTYDSDTHPNQLAHERKSLIVEDILKKM